MTYIMLYDFIRLLLRRIIGNMPTFAIFAHQRDGHSMTK